MHASEITTVFQFNDRIQFNCTGNTVLAPGSPREIVCRENGELSGGVPRCKYEVEVFRVSFRIYFLSFT